MVKEFEGSKPRPLHKMSLRQLEDELAFSEGIRHGYDRDDSKTHKALQFRVDEVRRAIECVKNGKPVDKDDE